MARVRTNNVFGTTTNNPLLVAGVTLNSAGLANLAVVTAPDTAIITLDPNRVNGAPEIVIVTAHTAAATSATITRGAEGTAAREHPSGTFWTHAATRLDYANAMCRVFHNAAQSIAHATLVKAALNSERFDTDTMHDTVTNNSRITFNTAGVYVVTFVGVLASASDYTRVYGDIFLNNTTIIAVDDKLPAAAAHTPAIRVTTAYKFAAADFVEARAFHTNGAAAARNLNATAQYSPEFSAVWVGHG